MIAKEIKDVIYNLMKKVDAMWKEQPSAGTKYRLIGLAADVTEVAEALRNEVLERASHEAVVDVDVDIDYVELSELVMAVEDETPFSGDAKDMVNEALGVLSDVLMQIDGQLSRRHKDEEYARLYEVEKRRYLYSGTSRRTKQDFEEWKDHACYGRPQLADIEDYRVEKLLKMFEKGVLNGRVEHMQRATRYPDEVDFSQVDANPRITKTVNHHYAALRKIVDYKDGCLVVDPVRAGHHFFASRKEPNAKSNRTNFLKYMHKISMLQTLLNTNASEVSVKDERKTVTSTADRLIKQAIETMMDEGVIKHSYDLAFVMLLMKETDGLPRFDSPNSFLTYISDLGIDDLPSEDSIKKKLSATFGKYPAWRFTDQKGKDATEAKRRNNVASRFLSLYRKGK